MRRCVLLGILFAAVAATPTQAAVRKGPVGTKFYSTATAKLVKGAHGGLIWARAFTGPERLKGGAKDELVLYRSEGVAGKSVAVSGDVAIPRGKAPKGGWPVITWAHGTTGIADSCAPTRLDTPAQPALLESWLKQGYAVLRTDYQGLGTPGVHPYLSGDAEGRSVLDIVRAARRLDRGIGAKVVIAGHSQGGHAALWAASLAPKYTPELKVRGTVAFAPANHIATQVSLAPSLNSPGGGTTGLGSLIIRGADTADPALGLPSMFTPQATALYPQTLTDCLTALDQSSSWGGLAPSQIFRSDADLTPLLAYLAKDVDPEGLSIKTPVRVEQGAADTTVFPTFTDQLVTEYQQHHVPVTYKTYAGIDHTHVVTGAPAADATQWIRGRLP